MESLTRDSPRPVFDNPEVCRCGDLVLEHGTCNKAC